MFGVLDGESVRKFDLTVLDHSRYGVVLRDIPLGINFTIIDLMRMHSFFQIDTRVQDRLHEAQVSIKEHLL